MKKSGQAFEETDPGVTTLEEWHPSLGERYKVMYDFLKHISTLSAGSLVLITTLIEKVASKPTERFSIALAVILFAASLVSSGVSYFLLGLNFPTVGRSKMWRGDRKGFALTMAIALVGFVMGMVCVAWFFTINWLRP